MTNQEPVYKFFNDFKKNLFNVNYSNVIHTDIFNKSTKYILFADLAGVKEDNIHLDYRNNILSISTDNSRAVNDKDLVCSELPKGNISRAFYIPDIQFNNIKADYNNGILKVVLPKY